ncbi:toprim domain-containing protein [Pseudoalteromonas sp. C2R02]|uniref:toprim domain-containing protein n=1 Tax=Pseudoalteromonas sp. C2R02 TaxID=2841565 RepID=UPI00339D6863
MFNYHTSNVLLFEGFIDFLSYLTVKKISEPPFTTVVLNSSVMMPRFIEFVNKNKFISSVDYFRDRDEIEGKNTGLQTLKHIQKSLEPIRINDISRFYIKYKDLNEWLKNELILNN